MLLYGSLTMPQSIKIGRNQFYLMLIYGGYLRKRKNSTSFDATL